MPEGPEIRRAADEIAAALEGKTIETVKFGIPRLRRYSAQLRGHQVIDIETRGKALLTHFEHGYSVYSHNQLYGVWRVIRGHRLPKTNRSLRLLLQTSTHSAILYSASDISVWPTAELMEHPFLAKIGPDIMDRSLTWRDIALRLREPEFVRKELAALYLDQKFLAGNGNYLRSEILHDARLHPRARPSELSRRAIGTLARSTLSLSQRSYETGGITLAPRLSNALKAQGLSRSWRRFYVFGRADQPCYHCGELIERHEVGSRRLYHCPNCQPPSAP
ncbi:MAG: endonuclease VIII [Halioglobus sp.]|nr:endonuclease VIII [Halioglobus sp.]